MTKKNVTNEKLSWAAFMLVAMFMLSSCLDGGGNQLTNTTVGIVRYDAKTNKNLLDVSAYESFYAKDFELMNEGTCCEIYYELNFDLPENSNDAVIANGYYTVSVLSKIEVDKYNLSYNPDTSATVLPNETPITHPTIYVNGYVKGVLFVTHQLKKPKDQRTSWELSCDGTNLYTTENGENIYDVYLRAKVRIPDTKTPEESAEECAYYMKTFLENAALHEKSQGKSKVLIRFNYVSEIKDEGTVVWSKNNDSNIEMQVNWIIPEESNK